MINYLLKYTLLTILCCIFLPITHISAQPLTIEDVLSGIEQKYSGKSFKADLTQITTTAAIDLKDTYSGKAWFSHPGKMKWQYISPQNHVFITNGTTLWFYIPEENQVRISSAEQFFKAGSGGAFLSDISLVRKNYTSRIKETTTTDIVVELIPIEKTPQISSIDLWVNKASYEIRQAVTRNEYNDTTEFIFNNIEFTKIDPQFFEFKPSNDMIIINEDQNI